MSNSMQPDIRSAGGRSGLAAGLPLPDGAVAFALPSRAQSGLSVALSSTLPLYFTANGDECRRFLRALRTPAFIAAIPSASGTHDLARVIAIRAQFPLMSMAGVFVDNYSDLGVLARLGGLGLSEVIPIGLTSNIAHVRAALSRSHTESLTDRIFRMTEVKVSIAAESLLRPALRLAYAPVQLPRLASAVRMHERSIRKYCHAHALPSPQWVVGWARCLLAAYYLEEDGRSVQSIAALLGFPSSALLANHLRRYTGHTATALRRHAPLSTVAKLLETALAPPSGSPHR
jgi:AraC-like DNA-binding protein